MRLKEIQFNQVTYKSDVSRYDFDDYIGNTQPTGLKIGGYEIHSPVNYPYKALLIKSNDDEGFLGGLQLTKFNNMWKSEIMFAPEIQGKGFSIPLYKYAIKDLGLTIVSDRSQSPGGAAIWEKLAQQPDINVYVYDTGDKKMHGKYDPRDSGRVYGVEDWRHKIRLVATTKELRESINENIYHPDIDDKYFKTNQFKKAESGGLQLVYGHTGDVFQIYAYSMKDKPMGAVIFRYDDKCDCYMADDVFVNPDFRRLGIATVMYDFARNNLDVPIKPSDTQTDDGSAFWRGKKVWENVVY